MTGSLTGHRYGMRSLHLINATFLELVFLPEQGGLSIVPQSHQIGW